MRLIVAMTGASGVILGIRLLEELKKAGVETHLVMSKWAKETILYETEYTVEQVEASADFCYDENDLSASISSGSFRVDGMVVVPCTMKTLSSINNGFSHNLIARSADVTIKEGRKLLLVPRETPLHSIHLRNMLQLSEMGVVILPPNIAFYSKPQTIRDIENHLVGKILDHFEIDNALYKRWEQD